MNKDKYLTLPLDPDAATQYYLFTTKKTGPAYLILGIRQLNNSKSYYKNEQIAIEEEAQPKENQTLQSFWETFVSQLTKKVSFGIFKPANGPLLFVYYEEDATVSIEDKITYSASFVGLKTQLGWKQQTKRHTIIAHSKDVLNFETVKPFLYYDFYYPLSDTTLDEFEKFQTQANQGDFIIFFYNQNETNGIHVNTSKESERECWDEFVNTLTSISVSFGIFKPFNGPLVSVFFEQDEDKADTLRYVPCAKELAAKLGWEQDRKTIVVHSKEKLTYENIQSHLKHNYKLH